MRNIEEKKIYQNFIDKCNNVSLSDESCIMGTIIFTISFIPLFSNVYAFVKMTMFYKKLNFENAIILISAIEIFILEFAITTSLDIFLQLFFCIQITTISLLIKKFSNLIKEMKSIFKNNIFFILVNVINTIIIVLYIVFMIIPENNIYVINLLYKIFYFSSTCILSYSCIFMNSLISKHKQEFIDNYDSFFDPNLLLNIDNTDMSDLGSIVNLTNDGVKSNSDKSNAIGNDSESKIDRERKGEQFYHIKKKQNRCLYIINLLCSSIELSFTIIRYFILHDDFLEDKFKIIPLTLVSEIFFYVYIFICFVNVSVIFFCFYYYIRRQYSRDPKVFKKRPSKKIIDEAFIEEQKRQDEASEMNEGIFTNKKTIRKISSNEQSFHYIDHV